MSKRPLVRIMLILSIGPLASACVKWEDAAIGAAGVVIADRIIEKQNGGDGLF